ncbi:lipoyl(octanoyl) transferase LipB [Paenibacillus yanchengensis]|uniref:Octanoyltransferase n=1 Tax=Paenibacillus yanchengensis TaxID=2035833 RepID=A0ABW4YJY6_9BACL
MSNEINRSVRRLDAQYIGLMEYAAAWDLQKAYVKQLDEGEREDTLLLLQHPPTFTIGTSKHMEHLLYTEEQLQERGITLFEIDRGGDITYHGPGQLVGYPIMFLPAEGLNLHQHLRTMEQVMIDWLATYQIKATRKAEFTGVWVGDEKIAAIGIKFNKSRHARGFITSHGFALNIKAGIEYEGFNGIIPCGIQQYGVTSFNNLTGLSLTVEEAAEQLLPFFCDRFGFR